MMRDSGKRNDGRIVWIDYLKAFGISLVFVGHAGNYLPESAVAYIYSFHMPLFFFISGYLNKRANGEMPFKAYALKYTRSMLVPYFVLGGMAYLFWVVENVVLGQSSNQLWQPLVGMIYSSGGQYELLHSTALWFLPSLFIAHMIHYAAIRLSRNRLTFYTIFCLLVSIAGFIYSAFSSWRLPWNLDSSCVAMLFFAVGVLFREKPDVTVSRIPSLWVGIVLLVLHGILFWVYPEKQDLRNCRFDRPLLYSVTALLGTIGWLNVFEGFRYSRFVAFVSKNTLSVFVFQHAFSTAWYFVLIETGMVQLGDKMWLAIPYSLIGVTALCLVGQFLRAFIPKAMGEFK